MAIRFHFRDSHFCFVNSHLAADMDAVDRRNSDFMDISKRMTFTFGHGQKREYLDHVRDYPWIPRWGDCGEELKRLGFSRSGLSVYEAE